MIAKISELKRSTNLPDVKSLCETTIAAMSSAIYNGVTPEARFEIERVAIENLFEGLSKFEKDNTVKGWLDTEKRLFSIKNIGVRKAINNLKESDGKYDQTLNIILEQFEEKINVYPEVLIYEEFISALSNNFGWMPGVSTELEGLSKKINQYKNDIDISKIIETMKSTKSNYLLPLIEDVVNNYLTNKTEQTKSSLKEALVKFSYDPFVRDLINIIMLDAKDLQLEYASANADIDKVYSPLLYLGESEVVFNVKGTFYIKKGNNINKLKKNEALNLDENFRSLCEAVNLPNIEFDRNKIKLYVGNDYAIISENEIIVNDKKMNEEELKNSAEISQWVGNTNFFMLAEALQRNFNEIVEIDFVKRVYLKENEGYGADIFKLRDNIFINTYDPNNNKSTFYRNINPIQAEKIMMEHMRFDVSKSFEDILPNKEKILKQIDEAKQSYVDYINDLTRRINEFEINPFNEEINKEIISVLKEELREVKNEYKDYTNEIEQYTNVSEGVTVSIDVDGEKYTVPIPQKNSTAKGEQADNTTGTVVGAEYMEDSPASEITFNGEESELLGNNPSMEDDKVDLGVDNVEVEADAAEAEAGEETETPETEAGVEGEEEIGLGDEESTETEGDEELGLGDEEETEEDTEEKKEEGEDEEYDENKDISEEGDNEEEAEEIEATLDTKEIATPEPEVEGEELEKTDLEPAEESTEEVEVEDVEAKEKPANAIRVYLKKKTVSESKNIKKNSKHLNENVQIGDTVIFDKSKGYVIGQTNDGDLLIQVQGSTHKTTPKKVKLVNEKPEILVKPPYEFDKQTLQNLTTKTLFEQFVKCGIYMGNTPVKLNDCFVKYSDWNIAENETTLTVLVEGKTILLPKSQVRILEDVNSFANPDAFQPGVIIDEETGDALEDVLINVEELMNAHGDADEVTIIKNPTGEQILSSAPNSKLRPAG